MDVSVDFSCSLSVWSKRYQWGGEEYNDFCYCGDSNSQHSFDNVYYLFWIFESTKSSSITQYLWKANWSCDCERKWEYRTNSRLVEQQVSVQITRLLCKATFSFWILFVCKIQGNWEIWRTDHSNIDLDELKVCRVCQRQRWNNSNTCRAYRWINTPSSNLSRFAQPSWTSNHLMKLSPAIQFGIWITRGSDLHVWKLVSCRVSRVIMIWSVCWKRN